MTTDGVRRLALMIGEIDAELSGKQVAGKDRVGTGIDQTVQQRRVLTPVGAALARQASEKVRQST
jgi:hypothetical protein